MLDAQVYYGCGALSESSSNSQAAQLSFHILVLFRSIGWHVHTHTCTKDRARTRSKASAQEEKTYRKLLTLSFHCFVIVMLLRFSLNRFEWMLLYNGSEYVFRFEICLSKRNSDRQTYTRTPSEEMNEESLSVLMHYVGVRCVLCNFFRSSSTFLCS